jgi:cation diffusion facilitator CzcD-associated flavoprotein CzcO
MTDSRSAAGDPETGFNVDVVVVGAGFAGLYMLHSLQERGLTARGFEAGSDVGGTWFWNRYPGARCDIFSMEYSYSFSAQLEQEWHWTERYPSQPEILSYLNHVADRFDLRRDITFNTRVLGATLHENGAGWTVATSDGEQVSARFLVMATGVLSAANLPSIPGLDQFHGEWYHTGDWPHETVDFAGKRVGVIGTGSSGIQAIPLIAEAAEALTVFQRTAAYSKPAHNGSLEPALESAIKADYPGYRHRVAHNPGTTRKAFDVSGQERAVAFAAAWKDGDLNSLLFSYGDLMTDKAANDTISDFVRDQIRSTVADPELAEMLVPHNFSYGTKRPGLDTGYYATYNRDNVTLVDVTADPIVAITERGIKTAASDHELDIIVFATGFDAMTGALLRMELVGQDGVTLAGAWSEGPVTYLGLQTPGFPNLFTVIGPGSPSVLSNVVMSIEQHVEWISGCLDYMQANELTVIEASSEAASAWTQHVQDVANETLYPTAKSWWMGANVEGKTRLFMPYVGGVLRYHRICEEVVEDSYRGFSFRST